MFRWFFLSFVLIAAFIYAKRDSMNDRIIDYKVKNKEFTIVVIKGELSTEKAKKYALKRAAELTREKGYRYFNVKGIDEVFFMKGKKNWPSAYDFPEDLYQELIIERGFNRERFIQKNETDSSPKPAIRLRIECMELKNQKSYDSCNFVKCK